VDKWCPAVNPSELVHRTTPYVRRARGLPVWGARDTRKTVTGGIDFRIQRQIRSWERQDDPPTRVKPIPLQILMVTISLVFGEHHSDANQAIAGMTIVVLFYLLRPGEYTGTTNDGATFRVCDLQLWISNQAVDAMRAPEAQLLASTSASLVFTMQKNGCIQRGHTLLPHHGFGPPSHTPASVQRGVHHAD
jgi:hypothetical protein